MHDEAYAYVQRQVAALGPFAFVVEVGARDVNGSVRWLFGEAEYLGIDIVDGPGVDVVADAALWEPPWTPDCVVCCEVLEHAPNAPLILRAARKWLATGGKLIATMATHPRAAHSAVDGHLLRDEEWSVMGPRPGVEFYRNVSPALLNDWLAEAGFSGWETEVRGGDLYVVA